MATLLKFLGLKVCFKIFIHCFLYPKILQLASSDLHKMQMDRKACLRVIVSLFWKQNGRHITEHLVGSLYFLQQKLLLRFSQISMLLAI